MTPSNDNGRCPETGCTHPAGTACTAWMCPGRSFKFSARFPSPRAGDERSLSPFIPALSQSLDHLLHDKGFTA